MLVHQLLEASARRSPGATYLIDDRGVHSFAVVDALSDRLAAGIQSGGIGRGDRVALVVPNVSEAVVALFGVLKAGAVAVMLNPSTTVDRLTFALADSGARAVVAPTAIRPIVGPAVAGVSSVVMTIWDGPDAPVGDVTLAELLERPATSAPSDVRPSSIDVDLAAILYTSGATGQPKGVVLTHRNLTSSATSIATYLANTPDDIVACVLPITFGYGLQQVLVGAAVGYAVLLERSFAFPAEVMERIARHRVTGLPGVPSIFSTILHLPHLADLDLSSVRYLTNAAAALPAAHVPRLEAAFGSARIFCMYGQTECTRVSYLDPARLRDKPGSVGTAIPNMEAWVARADGSRAGPGEVGELVVRGSGVMLGYWRRPEETAAVLRPGPIPEERILHTRDLFCTDEDGFLYFVGRTDDVFKTRGEKVAPKEIEGVIYELESVAEVVVVGVDHDIDGQAIKAIVVPRPGAQLDEGTIRRHCRGRLPSHLVPRFVELRSELPRTDSGKVRKTELV
jgi:acyl-CoA synthetase (AMP-forming)/AMP-acid ligase II